MHDDHDHDDEIARFGLCVTCATPDSMPRKKSPGEQLELLDGLSESERERLGAQGRRVADVMADGQWRTLAEIRARTGDPEASISARLRDLRKTGGQVDRRHRGAFENGLYEYRVREAAPFRPGDDF